MRDLNLKATEYFEAVARLGTVTKAAAELEVSPSAVSQQIDLLEAQLGVRLFRREKRRLVLTLDSVTLCLPEPERGELVPFCLDYPVIDFAAYWFVCPPRHLSRRIVKRFADWLGESCGEHEARARSLLELLGCRFRPDIGPDLIEVNPSAL